MRSPWLIQMGPGFNGKYPNKKHLQKKPTDGREGDVKAEVELGVIQPQGIPTTSRNWKKQGRVFS